MWSLIVFFIGSNFFLSDATGIPAVIQTGMVKNGGQFEDASNSALSLQKGVSNFDGDEGFNKLYEKKLLDSALNTRYGEQSNVKNNHLDAKHYNTGIVFNKNGMEGTNLEDKVQHKKGHHKNGFHNSYHKDEVGSNSSFYDDGDSEGGQHVFKNNQGTYANALEDSKRGDHLDSSTYNNDRGNQGHYVNGENYAHDTNNLQNHNRKQYYDDRRNDDRRNSGRRYGDQNNYNEETSYYNKPSYMPIPGGHIDSPRRRITIYEDPRYEAHPNQRYTDDYVELDVRPARSNHFNRPPPPPLDYF